MWLNSSHRWYLLIFSVVVFAFGIGGTRLHAR
jgi:hypothetical protein